ncbi:phospholipase D-like domain-containing protein [Chitinophaga sancti]|uniref:phospholipase D-like domain-containing protein n=1 Tax=Chitinophaga sancti TaxID=1004 RepID=UPI003F7B34AE
MEPVEQQVLNDNKEIYSKIQYELLRAQSEILVASAYFTDDHLFGILSDKLQQGVSIEIIIADNSDNERLDFSQLVAKGAAVYKIKGNGYGTMNQKFCVIDQKIALHGSYNWTINAKKNNHESIICTNHRETIDGLIENFNKTKPGTIAPIPKPAPSPQQQPITAGAEFEKVLDSMIAAEIGSFDRKLLREQGYLRCSANNGDHHVLYKAFDTLYSVFIHDIDVIDDKKKRLISKIEEYRQKKREALEKECELHVNFLEKESVITKNNLEIKAVKLSSETETIYKNIDDIRENKMPVKEKENEELKREIKVVEQESVRPKFKWFEFIPLVILNTALLIYLFIFYSSAAYILLFSVSNTRQKLAQGLPMEPPQIFYPDAITDTLAETKTAVLFIFLFVFIPVSFGIIDQFVKAKWKTLASVLGFLFGIIVLDGAIAYKVAQAVHEMNILTGNIRGEWRMGMAFSDTNFYLVFVFGAFGLILFKVVFKKMMHTFEERSPDTIAQKNQLKIKHLREEMAGNADKLLQLKGSITDLEIEIIQLKVDIKHTDLELKELPVRLNQNLQKSRNQLIKDLENIDKIATIYTIHIQSDNLPISVDALKDRINVFLEGWNDFLHQEYAIAKATTKTAQAAEVAAEWQETKIFVHRIDHRVKIGHNV